MSDENTDPGAIWVLRLIMGFVLLSHVALNVGDFDPTGVDTWVGLPAGMSDSAIVAEFVIAFLLILGILPRAAALAGAVTVLWGFVTARGPAVFFGPVLHWRNPAVWIFTLLLVSLLGDGAFVLVPTASIHRKETGK